MYQRLFVIALFSLAAFSFANADQAIESIQRRLKDEGFYYGDITGKKDTDTTAAIRRYQIRNGLQITGEINAETQRALGIAPTSLPPPRPRSTATPFRDEPALQQEPVPKTVRPQRQRPDPYDPGDGPVYRPVPNGLRPGASGIFDGTPFDEAPSVVQRRLIIGVQTLLARDGFYRSEIDGFYGPEMDLALRVYQSRIGLPSTGHLDLETLASLGLLPGQQSLGFRSPRRRTLLPRSRIGPTGERIYIPN